MAHIRQDNAHQQPIQAPEHQCVDGLILDTAHLAATSLPKTSHTTHPQNIIDAPRRQRRGNVNPPPCFQNAAWDNVMVQSTMVHKCTASCKRDHIDCNKNSQKLPCLESYVVT